MTAHQHDTLDGHLFGSDQPCFACGPRHPVGFRLSFQRVPETEDTPAAIVTHFTPGAAFQGPPGVMHGGLVSTLADELAAWALVGLQGRFGFTASFSCAFHKPLRIGLPIEGRATITDDRRRVVDVAVVLRQAEVQCYSGQFRFVVLNKRGAERLLAMPLPAHWERFCRES